MTNLKLPAHAHPIDAIHLDEEKFYEDLRQKSQGLPAWEDLETEDRAAVQRQVLRIWTAYEEATKALEADVDDTDLPKYRYFVSFSHDRGFGNCTVTRHAPWDRYSLRDVREDIEVGSPYQDIVIMNFQLVEGPENPGI